MKPVLMCAAAPGTKIKIHTTDYPVITWVLYEDGSVKPCVQKQAKKLPEMIDPQDQFEFKPEN